MIISYLSIVRYDIFGLKIMPLLNILNNIIEMSSVSAYKMQAKQCLDYHHDYLKQYGMSVDNHTSSGFSSLVATTKDSKNPKVLLQAHIDVVPAPDKAFQMVERDGKLYGRGVYDMKFAAACYLQLVEDLKDELDQYDFGIMLTTDEEVGGENGVGYLLDQGYSAEVCVLPDGGNDWALETACNGIWMVELIAEGKTAHGSRPWEGENAINKLTDLIHEIRDLFGDCQPYQHSLTVGQIGGGTAINQVPGLAKATLDMRFTDNAGYEKFRKDIENLANKTGVTLETIVHTDDCHTDVENPYIASFINIAEQVRGQKLETCRSFGSTDARFFTAHDIPTIVIRPVGGGHHSDEEWIDKTSLEEFYQVLKAYVVETARIV